MSCSLDLCAAHYYYFAARIQKLIATPVAPMKVVLDAASLHIPQLKR